MDSYIATIRRHAVLILVVAVVTTAAAYVVTARQPAAYQATSELLVNRNVSALLPDLAQNAPSDALSLNRLISTQSQLATVPAIATNALAEAHVTGMTPQQLLSKLAVLPKPNSDLISFAVTSSSPALAERLASAYANQFSAYQQGLLSTQLSQQIRQLTSALRATPAGPAHGRLATALATVVAASNEAAPSSVVVSRPTSATQTAPRPQRNSLLALAIGLLLGGGLAFLIDALDKRAHSTMEIGDLLGLNPLARIPPPSRRRGQSRSQPTVAMLDDPGGPQAEAVKMLQANIELACLETERPLTTVMFTSAVRQEGKSTTVANVAVSLAQAGRNVIMVDADLRWPTLARLFGTVAEPGLTEFALGEVAPDEVGAVLTEISLDAVQTPRNVRGRLRLLPAGRSEAQPDRLLSSAALDAVFATLQVHADIVLVDTPPLTEVYDGLIVSQHVDAVIPVARVSHVKLPTLAEFGRLLATMSALPLGYVATGVPKRDVGRYEMPRAKPAAVEGQSEAAGASRGWS